MRTSLRKSACWAHRARLRLRTTQSGSVYAVFYCPDAITCLSVTSAVDLFVRADQAMVAERADLVGLFLFLGSTAGGLAQWSAEGIDDGGTHACLW